MNEFQKLEIKELAYQKFKDKIEENISNKKKEDQKFSEKI